MRNSTVASWKQPLQLAVDPLFINALDDGIVLIKAKDLLAAAKEQGFEVDCGCDSPKHELMRFIQMLQGVYVGPPGDRRRKYVSFGRRLGWGNIPLLKYWGTNPSTDGSIPRKQLIQRINQIIEFNEPKLRGLKRTKSGLSLLKALVNQGARFAQPELFEDAELVDATQAKAI